MTLELRCPGDAKQAGAAFFAVVVVLGRKANALLGTAVVLVQQVVDLR